VYRNPGTYLVTLTVMDEFGHTSTATTPIVVALAGRITKLALTQHGSKLLVGVNGPGVLTAAGRTLRMKRAGTVRLPIRLNRAQRRRLARRHALTLHFVVRFTPAAGPPQSETLIVMFRPSHATSARLSHR
jgi:PKD repeat protein